MKNIIRQRNELYRDFSINLLSHIIYYYLDKDTLSNDNDIKNHYNWCFNKTCENFKKEEIDFTKNNKLKEYFYKYYYHRYYKNNEIENNEHFLFWKNVFNLDNQNDKNSMKLLMEIYSIFDEYFQNKNKPEKIIL
ncbi:MAG TPA: hypothetical protein PLN85_00305 [archaeon]|nr:hypothetical protein [archaeon]